MDLNSNKRRTKPFSMEKSLCNCKKYIDNFFTPFSTTQPMFTKLDSNHPCVKKVQLCEMKDHAFSKGRLLLFFEQYDVAKLIY